MTRGAPSLLGIGALLACLLSGGPSAAAPCDAPDHLTRETGGGECLVIRTRANEGSGPLSLFVLLHGNHSDGSPANSMFKLAETLAAKASGNATAVAILRPGYDDGEGNRSGGQDYGRADNFIAENVDIVADAIANLKAFHRPERVILVGHSGGAATAGVILGRHPGLADAALLVGCPCDVPKWRQQRRGGQPWKSESPHAWVERIPAGARVDLIVGGKDATTPPGLSSDYLALLKARGIESGLEIVEGRGHTDILRASLVIDRALGL